jgi:cytochrome c-type biogenesis protein
MLLGSSTNTEKGRNRAFTVILSLLVSIFVFTIIIFGTSNVLGIETGTLRAISAVIISVIGLITVFPVLWEKISSKFKISTSSNLLLGKAMKKDGVIGDILIGSALGPVFSSCSPTYGLIVATILPQNFVEGTLYLLWYLLGLGLVFALVVVFGRKFITKIAWMTNPEGWFKRSMGALFIIIGISVLFNYDKSFEAWLLQLEFYDSLIEFELRLSK